MKILIAYYSKTGETEKVAKALKKELETRGHSIEMERIKPVKERSFWGWWHLRMVKGECEIRSPMIKDVSQYDTICIGSPNWTRLSLPMARYLKTIEGLKYKKIGFFATTALPPAFEWYILSAYLLDLTFSQIIEKRGGRVVNSILFSSLIKKWKVDSKYGEKVIKTFSDKIETPILSLKEYILSRKEIEGTRFLIIIFSLFLFLSLIFQIILSATGAQIFNWSQYFFLFAIGFSAYFLMLVTMARRAKVFLGKYLAGATLVLGWTFTVLYLIPVLGRPIILGYISILIFINFFRGIKAVFFTGLFTLLGYGFLFLNYPQEGVLVPVLDLPFLFLSIGMIGFIAQNLQKHHIDLLKTQDEVEEARASLEIEIEARTKELRMLAGTLDNQVAKRTQELQEKIEELERFHKLAVGRELKMIELKNMIKELEKNKRSKK